MKKPMSRPDLDVKGNKRGRGTGFTLIELLIVVAIIAILAAIAVPNFLEAQTRAKVTRAKADMRTIATGADAYCVDWGIYPPNTLYSVVPVVLTTPVAYLMNAKLMDPFKSGETSAEYGELEQYYSYLSVIRPSTMAEVFALEPTPPWEAVDYFGGNDGCLARYGRYRLSSNGPDRVYSQEDMDAGPFNPNPAILKGCDIPYDASNGTKSIGNILRTQSNPEGMVVTAWR